MKKTSRRTFGKQLGGALAALPLASHLIEARADDPQKSSDEKIRRQFLTEHNTPPPGLFMGGSLVFEVFSDKNDWSTDGRPNENRRKWSVKPKPYDNGTQPRDIFIAHVKLVDGAGEPVFSTLNNSEKKEIKITVTLEKGNQPFGDCDWTASGDHFEIDVPLTKRLKKKNNDNPHNSRRQRVRYMHESGNSPDQCDWVGVKILKGEEIYYENSHLNRLGGYDETMRLMVWWENR